MKVQTWHGFQKESTKQQFFAQVKNIATKFIGTWWLYDTPLVTNSGLNTTIPKSVRLVAFLALSAKSKQVKRWDQKFADPETVAKLKQFSQNDSLWLGMCYFCTVFKLLVPDLLRQLCVSPQAAELGIHFLLRKISSVAPSWGPD